MVQAQRIGDKAELSFSFDESSKQCLFSFSSLTSKVQTITTARAAGIILKMNFNSAFASYIL